MICAAALSTREDDAESLGEVFAKVGSALAGEKADFAFCFASGDRAGVLERLADEYPGNALAESLIGVTGESIVGDGREIEESSAVALWACKLPAGATARSIRLSQDFAPFLDRLADEPSVPRTLVLVADPSCFPLDSFLKQAKTKTPELKIVGGMASASRSPGVNVMLCDRYCLRIGAAGALIEGAAGLRTIVSQGCRPIGRPLIITAIEANIIRELGRRPALEVLQEIFSELSPEEQSKARQGLHIGIVINEYQEKFDRGDFLVRNILAADESGGLAITDLARVGRTVQFHIRDAETASDDLRSLLLSSRDRTGGRPRGALLFTCNGRGSRLFDEPNHDVSLVREILGPIPIAGFFAMGEFGPVGGQSFLHGFTASALVFDEIE